jgi:hypothetical protein
MFYNVFNIRVMFYAVFSDVSRNIYAMFYNVFY